MTDPSGAPTTEVITDCLLEARGSSREAMDRLFPLVYEELRRIAHHAIRRERTDHTLGTTGLIHEAYFKLVDQTRVEWHDRAHFFGVAARAMRQILVDYARRQGAAKRGGRLRRVVLEEETASAEERAAELVAVDEALTRLAIHDPGLARVVESASSAGSARTRPPKSWGRARGPCSGSGAGPGHGSTRSCRRDGRDGLLLG